MKRTILYLMTLSLMIVGTSYSYAQNKDKSSDNKKPSTKNIKQDTPKKVKDLPSGHPVVKHNNKEIHVNEGRYYSPKKPTAPTPNRPSYTPKKHTIYNLIAPPYGMRVNSIPPGRREFRFGKTILYCAAGIIYEMLSPDEYVVVAPEVGMIVPELPEVNVHRVNINGNTLYEFEGILYKQIPTNQGLQYKVVGSIDD